MDKRNFVFNYVMKKSDFDHLQNDVEIGLNRLGDTIAGKGIVSGLEVTLSGGTAEISSGIAFDGSGKRIELTSSTTVDIGSIVRPATGKIKWITLVLKHGYREQGTLTDGHNKTWPERILDSYETEILEGTQAAEANATKPSVSSEQVVLIDIKADHSTPWASLVTDTGRRASPMPNILDITFPVGYIYAQYPGALTPAAMGWPGTWEAQFETEGVFFRTPSGRALAFGGGIQSDMVGPHTHPYYGPEWNSEGGGRNRGNANYRVSRVTNNPAQTHIETRPRNRTFRIWKRTR